METTKKLSILFLFICCLSCSEPRTYQDVLMLSNQGWERDVSCLFNFPVYDSLSTYDCFVDLRLRKDFAYKELPLFIAVEDNQGYSHSFNYLCNLSHFELSKDSGLWVDYRFRILSDFTFTDTGNYRLSVSQNSVNQIIEGVGSVGIKLQKHTVYGKR